MSEYRGPDFVTRMVRRVFDRVTSRDHYDHDMTRYAQTPRVRGSTIACGQWIAECTFHNGAAVCVAKSRELGCPEMN